MRFIPSHDEHGDALRLGFEFTNKLAAIVKAHLVGDDENADLLLSDVDSEEARRVSVLLHDLWVGYTFAPEAPEARGGGAPVDDSPGPSTELSAVPVTHHHQAAAPTHPGHSIKVS